MAQGLAVAAAAAAEWGRGEVVAAYCWHHLNDCSQAVADTMASHAMSGAEQLKWAVGQSNSVSAVVHQAYCLEVVHTPEIVLLGVKQEVKALQNWPHLGP